MIKEIIEDEEGEKIMDFSYYLNEKGNKIKESGVKINGKLISEELEIHGRI